MRYRGLPNLGATCYLNTVLHMLYMTKGFPQALERTGSVGGGVELQLKTLFGSLRAGGGASTWGLVKSLGIQNVFQQQDAAECLQKILHSLGSHLSQMFRGSVRNSTVCLSGGHATSSEVCPFTVLPLSIHSDCSVADSWEAFFCPSVLDGHNQMYCDCCEQKTDTETRCEMEQYPQVLTVQLKRFEFDFSWMCYVKNDCPVNIPLTLELERHTYELFAVADHRGTFTGGHYNACIKSHENQRFYLFDDAFVKQLNPQDLQTRSQSAYLLMYMRAELPALSPTASASPGLAPENNSWDCYSIYNSCNT
ncbi:hypothetical protein AGOR_G00187270 [Albula goreensis]|uniref:USP domain-containing protein n=1 Tax=Albula goreensis TaxID=1534307 RepID=A0A8T3CZ52_9TELE|nr:hypothetical protein AGOR_G00187270 [Albula goreensis]